MTGMEHECSPFAGFQVTFPEQVPASDVVVNGWSVPLLQAHLVGEDRLTLVLDERFAVEMDTDEAERLVPFIADAIAVALGFGCHPRPGTDPPLPKLPPVRPIRRNTLVPAATDED